VSEVPEKIGHKATGRVRPCHDVETALGSVLIGLMLHALLCAVPEQVLANTFEHCLMLVHKRSNVRNRRNSFISETKVFRRVSVEYLVWGLS